MKRAFSFLCIALTVGFPALAQETITLTTYYPAPFGVYQELRSRRMAIGNTYVQQSVYPWATVTPPPAGQISQDADLVVEGNVGIGTIDPGIYQLKVRGGNNNALYLDNDGSQYTAAYWANDGNIGGGAQFDGTNTKFRIVAIGANNSLRLGTQAMDRVTIDTSGNVGIGTTSPTEKLEIAGNAGTDGIKYPDGTKQTSALLRCASNQSTWGPITNGSTLTTSCPANYVGVSCEFVFYDTNNGVTYTGSTKSSWNANRTTCSQTVNDAGISQGAVYVDCCRIP